MFSILARIEASQLVINAKLDALLRHFASLEGTETIMIKEMQDLVAAVAAEKTVIDSAVALINGIPAVVEAAVKNTVPNVDPSQLAALTADITAHMGDLSAAVVANTPASPPAPPAPAA